MKKILILTGLFISAMQGKAQSSITEYFAANPNCVSKENINIEIKSVISSGACLNVTASKVIEMSQDFDAKSGSTFDARIGAITLPPVPVTPPTPVVTPATPVPTPVAVTPVPTPVVTPPPAVVVIPPQSSNNCENFQNHSSTNPHLTARASTNEFYGECNSYQIPEYKVAGLTDWKPMMRIANIVGSDNKYLHVYTEPYDVERTTFLRSRQGCPEYPDIRTQKLYKDLLRNWVLLPTNLPSLPPDKSDIIFFVNTELQGATLNSNIGVYNIYTTKPVPNLVGRVNNGGSYIPFKQTNWSWFFTRPDFNLSATDYFEAKKDFILDVSSDGWKTSQRFVVYRNHQGGHYSATITMTRSDGRVFVTTHSISAEVGQKLVNKNTGQEYLSVPQIDGVFDLGYLSDGDYNFELRTLNNFVAEYDVLVRVKRRQ